MGRLKQNWNEMFAEAEKEVMEEGCSWEAIAKAERQQKVICVDASASEQSGRGSGEGAPKLPDAA